MLASLNSKLYTVAALREIADRMGLEIKGKVTKTVLAGIIADAIEPMHAEAIAENRTRAVSKIAAGYRASIERELKSFDARMAARVNGYKIQRNGGTLTRKQLQRIGKKVNAHAARNAR